MARDANKVKEVTVMAAGHKTEAMTVTGYYNLSLEFIGSGTIAVQRSFDGGAHWKTISTYTTNTESVDFEPEEGVMYRLNCTAFTAGPIICRLSQ